MSVLCVSISEWRSPQNRAHRWDKAPHSSIPPTDLKVDNLIWCHSFPPSVRLALYSSVSSVQVAMKEVASEKKILRSQPSRCQRVTTRTTSPPSCAIFGDWSSHQWFTFLLKVTFHTSIDIDLKPAGWRRFWDRPLFDLRWCLHIPGMLFWSNRISHVTVVLSWPASQQILTLTFWGLHWPAYHGTNCDWWFHYCSLILKN